MQTVVRYIGTVNFRVCFTFFSNTSLYGVSVTRTFLASPFRSWAKVMHYLDVNLFSVVFCNLSCADLSFFLFYSRFADDATHGVITYRQVPNLFQISGRKQCVVSVPERQHIIKQMRCVNPSVLCDEMSLLRLMGRLYPYMRLFHYIMS